MARLWVNGVPTEYLVVVLSQSGNYLHCRVPYCYVDKDWYSGLKVVFDGKAYEAVQRLSWSEYANWVKWEFQDFSQYQSGKELLLKDALLD